ncbi:hypothetical protein Bca52824_011310 [Brassica carinata]|uniref:Uncharacterized protein n=1 Tax=Brassica carinata TaxID=52824 RepID=A0A8X8BBJ2_BRACI|nr:hypothetical protein Bca52824_011310 [Brassica carinata]
MNNRKILLQRRMEEENQARKHNSASSTRYQVVVANTNAAVTSPSEVAFNVCCFWVYCPLCILWCCIKQPCTIGWQAILRVKRQLSGCGVCARSLSRRVKEQIIRHFWISIQMA